MAKTPVVVEEKFRLDSLKTHEYVDPRGWFRLQIALGPQAGWRECGPGKWVEEGVETITPPAGSGARPVTKRRFRLAPNIATVECASGAVTNGLISASNDWISANQFARLERMPLHAPNGEVNLLALAGSVGRMLAVVSIEPTDPPAELANTPQAIARETGKAIVEALIEAGVITAKGK